MAYAVIKTGGKQYRVQRGDKIDVEKLDAEVDAELTFDVLMVGEGDSVQIGAPLVSGATVTGEVVKHGKGDKIVVFKFKRRKNYARKQGHRQKFTDVKINDISLG